MNTPGAPTGPPLAAIPRLLAATTLLLLTLAIAPAIQAQDGATDLAQLDVELWPDYDQPAVLALLTLQLPATTPLPATLVIPLPADATLNAVAYVGADGNLYSDLTYTPDLGLQTLTIITPAPRLRVEYYRPYQRDGSSRRFTFAWGAPLAIAALTVSVQQPAAAGEMTLSTPAERIQGQNELFYYVLPSQALSAGQAFTFDVHYTMSVDQLTAPDTGPSAVPMATGQPAVAVDAEAATSLLAWIGLAAAGLVGVVGWRWSRRPAPTRQPRPQRAASPPRPGARFCSQCGGPVQAHDNFCAHCGAALRS